MKLSDIISTFPESDQYTIINEKEFERFSRITSITSGDSCVFIKTENYVNTIPENVKMIITTDRIASILDKSKYGLCISEKPRTTFFKCFNAVTDVYHEPQRETVIGKNTVIGKMASVADHNVVIGDNVIIEDFVKINPNVRIGNNCIIRSGSVLGMEDYNYYEDDSGLVHINHCGSLLIEDNVDIGYCSTIGKSIYPEDVTIIGEGSKLSSNVAVGHDCKVGKRVMLYTGCILAGYVQVGDDTHVTLNCSVRNGISIGKNAMIDMGSVVIRNVADGETVFGVPARKIIVPKS